MPVQYILDDYSGQWVPTFVGDQSGEYNQVLLPETVGTTDTGGRFEWDPYTQSWVPSSQIRRQPDQTTPQDTRTSPPPAPTNDNILYPVPTGQVPDDPIQDQPPPPPTPSLTPEFPQSVPGGPGNFYDQWWENWYDPRYWTGSRAPDTPFSIASPGAMAEQNRLAARGMGQALDQSLLDAGGRSEILEGSFLNWLLAGPGGYTDILSGGGGFTPQEQQDLLQQSMLESGLATEEDLAGLGLQDWEMTGIAGSPYAGFDIFASQLPSLTAHQTEQTQRLREGFGPQGYLESPLYQAVNEDYLALSPDFLERYNLTDRDLQDIVDQAGRSVGLRGQAQREELERRAAAQGNTGPLALQAAYDRNKVLSDIASADAMTDARIRARGLGLDVARGREQMRLGTEQDISNRLMDIGSEVGQTRLATERGIGDVAQSNIRYGADRLADLMGGAESASSQRNAALAQARQNAQQQAISTRFGQAFPASEALATRYGNIYGQAKREQQEGRGFLSGQQAAAQEGAQVGRQQRIQAFGTQIGGINAPVEATLAWETRPKWWEQLIGAGAGAAGSFAGGG